LFRLPSLQSLANAATEHGLATFRRKKRKKGESINLREKSSKKRLQTIDAHATINSGGPKGPEVVQGG
jgi:hypothetical protein